MQIIQKLMRELFDVRELIGTADIDISASVYTAYVELLRVEPKLEGVFDLVIDLDFNKTTSGWDTISTASDTLDVAVFGKIDGTNYRHLLSATQLTAAGDGSHETAGVRFEIGALGDGSDLSVRVKLSAERADAEIPYRISYRGRRTPTVTPVAAG